MATPNAVSPIVYQLQQGLSNFDIRSWTQNFDLKSFVKDFDIKTVGSVAIIILAVVLVLDVIIKLLDTSGRDLALNAANAWQTNRDQIHFDNYGRNSRSLEPVTQVLDALAEAIKKWEDEPQQGKVQNRAF